MRKSILWFAVAVLVSGLFFGCAQQETATTTTTCTATTTTTSASTTTTTTTTSTTTTTHGSFGYIGTQSPGDVWTWVIGEGVFIGTNETAGKYYAGTYEVLPSGFYKGFLTNSSDLGAPVGSAGYFLEYPNTVLLVKPMGGEDNVIVCAMQATTAPSAGQYNFVTIPWLGWTTAEAAYGTAEVIESGGTYTVDIREYDIAKNFLGATTEAGFTFADGKLTKLGSDLQVFITPSGVFLADNGGGNGGAAGAKNETIDLADLAGKEYRGVLFYYDPATGQGVTVPVGAGPHPTKSLSLLGYSYTDIENNIIDPTSYATMEFGTQDATGVISGTMEAGSSVTNYSFVGAKINGKYVLAGIAAGPDGNPHNFLVVEKQ